ncbi:MAG: MOSC domain-containing protein [Angustibacter sp.]
MAVIEAVCVVHEIRSNGLSSRTAIDKRPVAEPVQVGEYGLAGDTQVDTRSHGGPDQAVYAYAAEDVDQWAQELGRRLPAGCFGENVRTRGLDITHAVIGERWRIGPGSGSSGGVLVEVTAPRTPCATFQRWLEETRWVKRFTERGAPGAYLRVVGAGPIAAGDEIEVTHRPDHGVTVHDAFHRLTPQTAGRLLDAGRRTDLDLHPVLRKTAETVIARSHPRA